MKYVKDYEKILARHAAFWRGERLGPCLCAVTSIKDDARCEEVIFPTDPVEKYKWLTDGAGVLKRYRGWFEDTYFAGDALPILIHDLGPAGHAGYFKGAKPRFEDSVWFEPSLENYSDLEFDPNSELYKITLQLMDYYVEKAGGEFIISTTDNVGCADVLSHLRGPENLMMDFIDEPEQVKEALKKVQQVWEKHVTEVCGIITEANYGGNSVGWLGTWAPGKAWQMQCDLSVMMSEESFGEFLLYELQQQSAFLDNSLYHLDGDAQIRHLPHILSLPRLRAVQWTNVAGQPPSHAYLPVLQQIQKAGKSLILDCSPAEVPLLMENLSASKMFLRTWADNQREADDLVALIAKLSRD